MLSRRTHRVLVITLLTALGATFGIAAGPAHAVRDTRVIVKNETDTPLTLSWWTRALNVDTPSVVQVAPGESATVTGSSTGNNWDVVGSIGRTWQAGGDSTFRGVCFAGDNPGSGYPRFEMGRYLEQDRSITLAPEPCDLDVQGAWSMPFNTFSGPIYRTFSVVGIDGFIDLRSDNTYRIFKVIVKSLPSLPNSLLKVENTTPALGRVISDPAGLIDCGTTACSALIPWGSQAINLVPVPAPGMIVDGFLLAENINQPSSSPDPLCFWKRPQRPLPTCTWNATTGAPTTYRVAFAPAPRQPLTTSLSGDGGGRILDDHGALDCNDDGSCSASLIEGSTVALHAVPDADSRFGWWTGACRGKADTCIVSMSSPQSVEAVFLQRTDATLSVTLNGAGLVSGDRGLHCRTPPDAATPNVCSVTVPRGATVKVVGAPVGDGSRFTGWSGPDAGACSADTACTLTLNRDAQLRATFQAPPTPLPYSVTKSGSGSGRVTGMGIDCGPTCSTTVVPTSDRIISFEATPDPGSNFVGWGGICFSSGTLASCRPKGAGVIKAVFAARSPDEFVQVVLEVQGNGSGRVQSRPAGVNCTATCTTSFDTMTGRWLANVTLTATPDADSVFVGWQGKCWSPFPQGECVLDMTESRAITAVFQPRAAPSPTPIGPPDPDPGVVPEPNPQPVLDPVPAIADAPVSGPPTVPTLSRLRTTRRSFKPWQGTVVRYVLNRPADLVMTFTYGTERRPRYRFRIPSGADGAKAGANSVRIVGRIRNHDVRTGRWTIRVVARTDAGSSPTQVRKVSVRPG